MSDLGSGDVPRFQINIFTYDRGVCLIILTFVHRSNQFDSKLNFGTEELFDKIFDLRKIYRFLSVLAM